MEMGTAPEVTHTHIWTTVRPMTSNTGSYNYRWLARS